MVQVLGSSVGESASALSHTAFKMPVRKKNSLKCLLPGLMEEDSRFRITGSGLVGPVLSPTHRIQSNRASTSSVQVHVDPDLLPVSVSHGQRGQIMNRSRYKHLDESCCGSFVCLCAGFVSHRLQEISLLTPPHLHGDEQTSARESVSLFHDET